MHNTHEIGIGTSIIPGVNESKYASVVCFLLDSVDETGRWGGSDFENWAPVVTALTVDLLLNLGFDLETSWIVGDAGSARTHNLKKSIQYLNSSISSDGEFGEDIWDSAKLGQMILRHSLEDEFSRWNALKSSISNSIKRRSYRSRVDTWEGPGTMAALISYCELLRNETEAASIFSELIQLQSDTGEFHGSQSEHGNDLASPVWHTAQVLLAFFNRGLTEKDERVAKSVEWLEKTQTPEGAWRFFHRYDVYFTCYAIMALSRLPKAPTSLTRALSWLDDQVSSNGKVADEGGSIMAALAYFSYHGHKFHASLEGAEYHNARKLGVYCTSLLEELSELQSENSILGSELSNRKEKLEVFERRFGDADFGVTTKQVFVVGLIVAILFSVGIVAGSKVLDGILYRENQNKTNVSVESSHLGPAPKNQDEE